MKRPRAPPLPKTLPRRPQSSEVPSPAPEVAAGEAPSAESTHPTTASQTTENQNHNHPKGHRTAILAEVWGLMDDTFLRNSDTAKLMDVWCIPTFVQVIEKSNLYVNVEFRQFVLATHVKERTVVYKMFVEDLLKMFYLASQIELDCAGEVRMDYDGWLSECKYLFMKEKGSENSESRPKLVEFLLNENHVPIHPIPGNPKLHTMFRKVNCHSYKASATPKFANEFCAKCKASKGKYEYVIEARIAAVPIDTAEVTPTQPMD